MAAIDSVPGLKLANEKSELAKAIRKRVRNVGIIPTSMKEHSLNRTIGDLLVLARHPRQVDTK